jgi:hypothetical protein
MAFTRSINAMGSCTSDLPPIPSEASERSGFTNRGIRRLPPVSKACCLENTANLGYRMPSKASNFLVSPLSWLR